MDSQVETLTEASPAEPDAAGSMPGSADSVVSSPELELVSTTPPALDEVGADVSGDATTPAMEVAEPATESLDSVSAEPEAAQAAAEPVDTVSDSPLDSAEPVVEAVAEPLVEAHGGRIWAQSASGQGAQFTFALPKSA